MLIYVVCGYMMKTRRWLVECEKCKEPVLSNEEELPCDFEANDYTSLRTKGGLLFVTVPLFQTLCEVEKLN